MRSLLIGLHAVGGTGIPDDMAFGDVVKNPPAGGCGVVEHKYIGSVVYERSDLCCPPNKDRSRVMGTMHDFNIVFDYESRGAFVLATTSIVTHFTATYSGNKLFANVKSWVDLFYNRLTQLSRNYHDQRCSANSLCGSTSSQRVAIQTATPTE